jgi:hypothetical protein
VCSILKFSLEQFVKAQRGSIGIDVLFLLTSALDGLTGQHRSPTTLLLRKRPGTHFIGGSLGPRAGLDRFVKTRSHRNSIQYLQKCRESRIGC